MPIAPISPDGKVRRIKSKHDLGDVVMNLNDNKVLQGVPDEVLQVLADMTLGGTDNLHLWEIEKCAEILDRVKTACAPSGEKPSYEQCNEGVDLLMRLMQAKNDNHPEMVYTHLPQQLQSVFKCWDLDGSGSVSAAELHSAAGAWTKMHEEKSLLKRLLFGAVLTMLVLFVGIFVLSMVTSELSKEFKSSSSGGMIDKTGRAVRVASTGFDVSSDGSLQVLGPQGEASCTGDAAACARRLASDGGSTLVSTQKVRKEKALHSALADTFFDALDEITIHSEKGHRLNLKISGFARVPVLGSRCGNVVHLFSVVDGHLTLDSTDISFSGHLESLFSKAGFELAVGGAAGRRLAGTPAVTGFFNHVADARAAGWTCKEVPLPKTPKTSTVWQETYTPCSSTSPEGKVTKGACDSKYGGFIVGVSRIPAQHLVAASTRLEDVRRRLGQDVESDRVVYSKVRTTVMRSPSYQVQFTHFPNHPKQEQVIVVNKVLKQGVSFQRSLSGSVDRTFCEATDMKDEPVTTLMQAEASGVNASMHMEFLGVVGELDGRLYRHWRMMASDSFRKWMLGEAGAKDANQHYYEFWDDAQSLEPHRMVESSGVITVFERSSEGATDADVEAALGPANGEDALLSVQGTDKPYPLTCSPGEADSFHPVYGTVPAMHSPLIEPSGQELNFYVVQLAEDTEDEDDQAQSAAVLEAEETANSSSTSLAEKEENLQRAWIAMKTIRLGDEGHDFARYALRSKEFFAMPDACADVCSKPLAAAQTAMEQQGREAFCSSAPADLLLSCLADLEEPLLLSCQGSPFQSNTMGLCREESAGRSLEEGSDAKVDTLADGSHSVDLGSLQSGVRDRLGSGLEAAGGVEVGDMSKSRLLVNSSAGDIVVVDAARIRRLKNSLIEWCGDYLKPFCFAIKFPKGCCPAGVDEEKNKKFSKLNKVASLVNKMNSGDKQKCQGKTCKAYLKVVISLPNGNIPFFGISVTLSGSIQVLKKLGIPNPPIYGELFFAGGIRLDSNQAACPESKFWEKVPFNLQGFVEIGASAGLDLIPGWLPRIEVLSITLKGGAKIKRTERLWFARDISHRRRCGCGRPEPRGVGPQRRRKWGDWSRRRAPKYQRFSVDPTCEVVVYVKVTVKILCIRAWLLVEYFTRSGRWLITLGADYFKFWLLWAGYWENFGSWSIMDEGKNEDGERMRSVGISEDATRHVR